MKNQKIQSFIEIKPNPSKKIEVTWGYTILYRNESDGMFSCFIPGFEIYFSALNKDAIEHKSKVMMQLLFDHFFIHNADSNPIKSLSLHLRKLGFRINGNDTLKMRELINNVVKSKSKFSSIMEVPFEFNDAAQLEKKSELEFAL